MDVRKSKRRQFSCMHCMRSQRSHVAERYRMVAHIYKHHLALDQAPFYCTLCLFRSTTKDALEKHVTSYAKHAAEAFNLGGDPRRFLGQNPNPRLVQEGIDFRLATAEEVSRKGSSENLSTEIDDEPVGDNRSQDGLISVRLTPEVLADILNRHGASVNPVLPQSQSDPENDPLRPGYGGLPVFQSTSAAGLSFPGITQPLSSYAPSISSLPLNLPMNSSTRNHQPQRSSISTSASASTSDFYLASKLHTSAPPLVNSVSASAPSLGDTFITSGLDSVMSSPFTDFLAKPVFPPATEMTAKSTSLNTPTLNAVPSPQSKSPSVVDIKEQLLGTDEPTYTFSPPTKTDTASQTEASGEHKAELAPIAASTAITHMEKVLEVALRKVADAIDRNSRVMREVERSVSRMADSFTCVERSVDRLVMEQRSLNRRTDSTESAEKRPRIDENRKPLKSSTTHDKRNANKK